jgi:hypothetical protein
MKMTLPDKNKIVSVTVLLISLGFLGLIIGEQIERYRVLDEISDFIAVDTSPDALQRDIRIFFALFFNGLILWSRKGAKIGIICAAVFFVFIEAINLATIGKSGFDTPEPQIHFLAAILLLAAIGLLIKGFRNTLIAALTTIYILFEYLFWFVGTRYMFASVGVEYIYRPNTLLNRIFYGANWWHVFILVLSISLFILEIIIYVRYMRSSRQS